MHSAKILIVKTGTTADEVRREHGDFETWFSDALGGHPERFTLAYAYRDGSPEPIDLPDFKRFDGVIVTGSPSSVTEPTPWMEHLGRRMVEHADAGGAVLGVCFGHQLFCHALGAPVIRNPSGREIGSVEVELTEEGRADPLFDGLPARLEVNCTHVDRASRLPDRAALLAKNANSPVQALRYGRAGRGVQFHPEISPPAMRSLIRTRAAPMRSEGLDPDTHERGVKGSPMGLRVLWNFEQHLCGRG
jgi:GMP synthase (glutamine-hydrolysing)